MKCQMCGINIGEDFIEKEVVKTKVYKKERLICRTCFNELAKMKPADRSIHFKFRSFTYCK